MCHQRERKHPFPLPSLECCFDFPSRRTIRRRMQEIAPLTMTEKTMLALLPRVKSSLRLLLPEIGESRRMSLVAVEKPQEIRFYLWKSRREHWKYREQPVCRKMKNKREIYAKISLAEHDHHNALSEIRGFVTRMKAS